MTVIDQSKFIFREIPQYYNVVISSTRKAAREAHSRSIEILRLTFTFKWTWTGKTYWRNRMTYMRWLSSVALLVKTVNLFICFNDKGLCSCERNFPWPTTASTSWYSYRVPIVGRSALAVYSAPAWLWCERTTELADTQPTLQVRITSAAVAYIATAIAIMLSFGTGCCTIPAASYPPWEGKISNRLCDRQ